MCWCPITNLDTADEAYEWMMGVTRSGLTEEEQHISDQLAEAFAAYINSAGIKDPDGLVLTLSESADGIYQAGSYYDYMKTVIEESLNHFLSDTEFPYDASSASGGRRGGFGGGIPGGFGGQNPFGGEQRPERGEGTPDFGAEQKPDGEMMSGEVSFEELDDITRNETTGGVSLSGTYETAQDYIDALNAEREWVHYDAATNTASITSIEDFVLACKSASKNLGAFDQLDGGQGENTLFGYSDGNGAHFDAILADILNALGSDYAADYAEDLAKQDSEGNTVDYRVNMYTPLYYLLESSEGYQESTVAKYWRIRTGIAQGDCSLFRDDLGRRTYPGGAQRQFDRQLHCLGERLPGGMTASLTTRLTESISRPVISFGHRSVRLFTEVYRTFNMTDSREKLFSQNCGVDAWCNSIYNKAK